MSSRRWTAGATLMRDTVRYAVGFGVLGEMAPPRGRGRDVEAIFAFRAERVPALLGVSGRDQRPLVAYANVRRGAARAPVER